MNMIEKIQKMMSERNLTKADAAKGANIPYTTFDGIFKKGYENMKLPTIQKLAVFFNVSIEYLINNEIDKDEPPIPQEYTDKYKLTPRDKSQHMEFIKKETQAFFMDDKFDEEDKKEILDTINEIFWKTKTLNKRKTKDE